MEAIKLLDNSCGVIIKYLKFKSIKTYIRHYDGCILILENIWMELNIEWCNLTFFLTLFLS